MAADQLAIEMRAKHFGLTIEQAKNSLSGTYIGRLYLHSKLNQDQYDAAQKYLQIKNDYLCAKGLPYAIYDDFSPSSNEEAQKQWIKKATNCYEGMKEVIKEAQCFYHQYNLHSALQYLVVEDKTLPHLVPSLHIVLNALHKHFTQNR
ncbi:hypothetical protein [Bartonella rochalimae]|uniref:Uncharacterized protein n=1 Tax=Bartonella rochalimae ATCC BAA-1498 TaxID=685782 RepID=E6YMG7_9HYPH|nr:hypothetical protein O99_00463 [Bartonella rochalimae ATCC BAA-1498]CBI78069.1 conserved hypothetical protein [Bartonella rochalimae ATCC BAA-1498]